MFQQPQIRELTPTEITDTPEGYMHLVPRGWPIFVAGNFPGLQWSYTRQAGSFRPIKPGQTIPAPPEGQIHFRCFSNNLATSVRAVIEAWPPSQIEQRAAGAAAVAVAGREGADSAWLDAFAFVGAGETRGIRYIGDHGGRVSMFGTSTAAVNVTALYSTDGITWREGPTVAVAAAGDFAIDLLTSAPFVALRASAATAISAELSWR